MPKKIHQNSIIGQQGINLIERIVMEVGFVWRMMSGEDVGIDGIIEIRCSSTGNVGGQYLGVQSKATTQRFTAETVEGFEYLCKPKDVEYWLSAKLPIILICSRPKTSEVYWVSIQDYFADSNRRRTNKIYFDKQKNKFGIECKDFLEQIAVAGVQQPSKETIRPLFVVGRVAPLKELRKHGYNHVEQLPDGTFLPRFIEPLSYINSKGQEYFLHEKDVILKGGKQTKIHYFSRAVDENYVLYALPPDRIVAEYEQTGLPLSKKKKPPRDDSVNQS